MKTAPLLSIGMIFKNEARCLERCLKSLQPLRDAVPCELIMADTGSDDGSREIAERYADEVIDFPWIDDFAAARNAVMEKCSGKWYFSVDCDEWLDADLTELLAFLRGEAKADCAFVIVRNYESPDLEQGDGYDDFRALRLLRMASGRRFQGAIHESFGYREPTARRLTHTVLHHDGYVYVTPEDSKKKMTRNLKILRQKLAETPEDLRTLLQCIESGRHDPEYVSLVRQGVAAVQKKCHDWKIFGPCIFRHAVQAARTRELSELDEWEQYAEEQFPDSIFTRVDLNYSALLAAHKEKQWEKAIRYGEAYRQGLRALRAKRRPPEMEEELGLSSLFAGSRAMERNALVGLAEAYLQTGRGKEALALLTQLEGEKLTAEQVRITVIAFCPLHAQTEVDVAPALADLYARIGREQPNPAARKARLAMFDSVAALPFAQTYRREEQKREAYLRPAYTAFACLAQQCEAGRGAVMLQTQDPAALQALLAQVENWQALPIEALEHALAAGVPFPPAEQPLPIEALDGLAARLTHGENTARRMALALPEGQTPPDLQSLLWAQAVVLAALRSFDWTLGKSTQPASAFACPQKPKQPDDDAPQPPEDTPETGLALLRRFAALEAEALPQLYTPQLLTEQNAALLPPMHRWGLFCALAFASLNRGQPQEYLAMLRHSLKHCPGQKSMVQFLLDRFLDDARPKASPELLALAEKVRGILAAYGPDNPAAKAIRESDAYKQVAWLLEETPGLPVQ